MAFKVRRPRYRKKVVRRRKVRVPRAVTGTGGFTITRRCDPIYVSNASALGTYQISTQPGSFSQITLGTVPLVNPVVPGHYSVPFTMVFALDQVTNYSELIGIADRFMIKKINVKFLYNANAIAGSGTTAAYPSMVPILHTIVDKDDATLQTLSSMREKMGLKMRPCGNGKFHQVSFSPHIAQVVGTGSQYAVGKAAWINSTYPATAHYGLKGYFENWNLQSQSTGVSCWTIETTVTLALRDLQ